MKDSAKHPDVKLFANRFLISPSAIKEIKINQDLYSPEYQRPGRGRIEVTTKPGSAEYHGINQNLGDQTFTL